MFGTLFIEPKVTGLKDKPGIRFVCGRLWLVFDLHMKWDLKSNIGAARSVFVLSAAEHIVHTFG